MKLQKMIQRLCYVFLFASLTHCAFAQATIAERQKKAREVEELYSMAEQAYNDGDISAARDVIKSILALNPRHAHTLALRRKIRLHGGQMVILKKKRIFNAVKLDKVEYKDLTLRQALKLLGAKVEAASHGKVVPNFVVQDPKRYLGKERINLTLQNIPAGVVLSNLLQTSKCSAVFGKYTISIRPRPSAFVTKTKPVKKEESTDE